MLDFVIEFILDLVLEGSYEVSKNKNIPKIIRYPLILIVVFFFLMVILVIGFLGIIVIRENLYFGLLIILLAIIFLVLGIKKFRKVYLIKSDKLK